MTPSWTALLLSAALTIVLSLLWLQMRRRGRAAGANAGKPHPEQAKAPAPDTALADAPDDPPALHAVRDALSQARADAAKQAPGPQAEAPARPPATEATAPATAPAAAPDAQPAAAAAPHGRSETDRFDDQGRLVLQVAMGDAIAPAGMPRRLELTVRKQWPLPVVHGFDAEHERLVLRYAAPEARDVVFLPTVEDTWQISLGGRPVIQVACAQGPAALAAALRINP